MCNYSFAPLDGFSKVHQKKKHLSDILKKETCNEYRIIYVISAADMLLLKGILKW